MLSICWEMIILRCLFLKAVIYIENMTICDMIFLLNLLNLGINIYKFSLFEVQIYSRYENIWSNKRFDMLGTPSRSHTTNYPYQMSRSKFVVGCWNKKYKKYTFYGHGICMKWIFSLLNAQCDVYSDRKCSFTYFFRVFFMV